MTRPGLVLDDRYRLTEPIAAGGVGQVWRAADLLLDRPVAVKLLRPEYADHPDTLERFRAEARHAGSLTHPCIARVYDYANAGSAIPPYLVMEYVNGPSLADMLAVDPVHPVLALDVVAQAAAGLDAAHRIGLVHRDVKPGNILVGEDGLVKITDFGIAHAAGSAPITGPGLVMGTTQYMAPERIAGGPATPASDLYSLGILIYECLTGVPPFDGGTAEVMAGHLYLPLPPLPPGVPPAIDELVARLTAKDPAVRLSDAAELAALARRLRDALAADAGLVMAAPALAGAAVGGATPAHASAAFDVDSLFTGSAPHPAAPRLSGSLEELPPQPPAAPSHARPDRPFWAGRRRAAALAAGATMLAGAGVVWLLVAGTAHDAPTADHMRVSPPAAGLPGTSASGGPVTAVGPGGSAGSRSATPPARTHKASDSPASTAATSPSNPATSASASRSSTPSQSPSPSASTSSPGLPWPLPLVSIGV